MVFVYQRTVRFCDTDAAGVMYFSNALNICHEAYEASLIASGINVKDYFSNRGIAVPITHASIDYLAPSYCGDQLYIQLFPRLISASEFEIVYEVIGTEHQTLSQASTRHVSISIKPRHRVPLMPELCDWIQKYEAA